METKTNILTDAGLDFDVEKRPHWFERINDVGQAEFIQSDMSCGIFRTDNGAEIGDVGKTYEIAQYSDVVMPWLEAVKSGHLQYQSGRALDNGRRFSLTFETGTSNIAGEDIRKRIIVGGSHDGSWAVFMKTFLWRQICSNGMMGFGLADSFRAKHTENWKNRYESILQQLSQTDKFYDGALTRYRQIFNVKMDLSAMRSATSKLLDIKGELRDESTRKQNQLVDIMSLTQRGRGILGNSEIQGTAAAWYNAVTEYVDHHVSKDNLENQFTSAFFGAGETRKKKAFEIAYSMV